MNWFIVVIAITFLFRFLFATFIPLIDDEAYHWSWTQGSNFGLSYFDHPAMIAWLEKISTAIFGNTFLGVRLPSFLCLSAVCYIFYKLTKEIFGESAARFVVLMILFVPFWGFGGHVASPETPFILCWALGMYVFWRGYCEDQGSEPQWSLKKTWIFLGVIMGLGLNSKFIIATLAFGFGAYILLTPHRRKDLLSPWPWIGILIATVLCLPIFIWNVQADWPGFRYQFHDRHADGGGFDVSRWLVFWAAQFLFYTPVGYLLLLFTFFYSFIQRHELKWRWIYATSLPTFLIFYPQPLFAENKPHWSGSACMIVLIGAGAIWQFGAQIKGRQWIKPKSRVLLYSLLAILIPFNVFIYSPFFGPWWPKAYRAITQKDDFNPRWDLSNEFYGWEEAGKKSLELAEQLKNREGKDVFIASHRYETTAQLWWGAKHPVYMLSKVVSHYTVRQRLEGLDSLMGQSAIFLTTEKYPGNPMDYAKWDSCESQVLKTYRGSEPSREFTLWSCRNFQGIL